MCSTERTRAHVLRARYPSQTHLPFLRGRLGNLDGAESGRKTPGASLSPEGRLRRGCGGGVRASRRPRRALHVPFERLVSRSVSGGFVSTLRLGEHSPQPRIKNLIRQRARHRRVNQPGRIRRERHSRGGLTSRIARERRSRVAGSLVNGSRVLRRRLSHGLSRSPVHGSCWDGRVRGSRVLRRRLSHGLSRSRLQPRAQPQSQSRSRELPGRSRSRKSRSPSQAQPRAQPKSRSRKLLGRSRSRKSRSSS